MRCCDGAQCARGRGCGVPLRCDGRRGPEHVRGGAVRARERRGDGGAAGGADRAAGRAAGRRVEHEHLRRGPLPRDGRPRGAGPPAPA